MPANTDVWFGQNDATSDNSEFNRADFHINQVLRMASTATLVKVQKVKPASDSKAVGMVDVQPLVNMLDGAGRSTKHGTVFNLPYFRLQGSADRAVILDPQVGDVGVAVFADRDISAVKKNKAQSNPGSRRRFDMADGMFFGCFLGGHPKCRVEFTTDNHVIVTPDDGSTIVDIQQDQIKLKATSLAVYISPTRIDLGKLNAPHAVQTVDGPSLKVFAVINETDS